MEKVFVSKRSTCCICGTKRYSHFLIDLDIPMVNGCFMVCRSYVAGCSSHKDIDKLRTIANLRGDLQILKTWVSNLE